MKVRTTRFLATLAICGIATAVPSHPVAHLAKDSYKQDFDRPAVQRQVATPSFSSTNGTHFTIDGKIQYLAGTNAYWLPFLMNNTDVDLALDQIQSSGITILRIWGFNDVNAIPNDPDTVWFQYLSSTESVINTGVNGLERLDYVVSAAEKRGIKLIVPFVNNWNDYGGMNAYTTAFGTGGSTWYKNPRAQKQYLIYITAVVSRYATSPAIFAWELANEPRCMFCSTDDIFNWATETSAFVKSLDPNHMITLGDEGMGLTGGAWLPYWLIYGTDYWRNLQIKTLDFGTFHIYPTTCESTPTAAHLLGFHGLQETYITGAVPTSFVPTWITAHAEKCVSAGKPCLMEEYGVPASNGHCAVEKPWQQLAFQTPGIAGDAFWQLGTVLSSGKTSDDTFTIYYNTTEWDCLVTDHIDAINSSQQ